MYSEWNSCMAGRDGVFSSLRTPDAEYPLLNLEEGRPTTDWGLMLNEVNMVSRSTAALSARAIPEWSVQRLACGFRALHSRQDIFAEELHL
jgi:hypothetical protein